MLKPLIRHHFPRLFASLRTKKNVSNGSSSGSHSTKTNSPYRAPTPAPKAWQSRAGGNGPSAGAGTHIRVTPGEDSFYTEDTHSAEKLFHLTETRVWEPRDATEMKGGRVGVKGKGGGEGGYI